MAESDAGSGETPKKSSKLPILMGVAAALVLGAAGFFATYSGMIGGAKGGDSSAASDPDGHAKPDLLGDIVFVPLEPLIVSLSHDGVTRHLRFKAQLEVAPDYQSDVTHLMPRILDVLNGYLRAVAFEDLEKRSALVGLRAQMLRRIQIVTGDGRVRDLLVTEFVMN